MADKKVQRLRFSYEDDLMLLREFINVNPISNPEGWEHIQRNISLVSKKDFQIRTIKNHLALLIELFLKKIKVEQIQYVIINKFKVSYIEMLGLYNFVIVIANSIPMLVHFQCNYIFFNNIALT